VAKTKKATPKTKKKKAAAKQAGKLPSKQEIVDFLKSSPAKSGRAPSG
jgi:hypothetical protein